MQIRRQLLTAKYVGPGDVLDSAYAWYSPARAYSAAFAASRAPIMDLQDQAGANPIAINILPSGFVDLSAILSWVSRFGVTTIKVARLYDQTGNGRDVVQATLATMPGLTLNSTPKGTLPAVDFNVGTNPVLATTATYTQVQPLTMSAVYIRTTGTALGGVVGGNADICIGAGSGANVAIATSTGAGFTAVASDNTWHAINALLNGTGTSSAINIDGAETTGSSGSTSGLVGHNIRVGRAAASALAGRVSEAGIWPVITDPAARAALSANQHSVSNGYNF